MQVESKARTFLKTLSWRVFGSSVTALFIFVLSGEKALALLSGGFDLLTKSILFYFHERIWNRFRFGKKEIPAHVIWLTGLSASGKSTISKILAEKLRSRGLKTEELDGDVIRAIFPQTGFSKEDRDQHVKRVGFLASRLESNHVFTIASLISPYRDSRDFVRKLSKNFIEVYVATPLSVCEKRDPKGLYQKARTGEIPNMTGINDPYEAPLKPEIIVDTNQDSADECAETIYQYLLKRIQVK